MKSSVTNAEIMSQLEETLRIFVKKPANILSRPQGKVISVLAILKIGMLNNPPILLEDEGYGEQWNRKPE